MDPTEERTASGNDDMEEEVRELEGRPSAAKPRLGRTTTSPPSPPPVDSPTHYLLLLSDSQLPIGSFAFSSGLESYLAHERLRGAGGSFSAFLGLSLSSFAATTLPFVLASYRAVGLLVSLDEQLDAAVMCTVGRRASVAQGRALLSVWERSFRGAFPAGGAEATALGAFGALLRRRGRARAGDDDDDDEEEDVPGVSAHLAPVFGVVGRAVGLSLRQTAYVYMVGHAKALVSAAVRASVFGPYEAQRVLAGGEVQGMVGSLIEREWGTAVEDAGQSVPVMDLWVGRHEVLYSRIFNS